MTQASRETHAKSSGHFLDELRATFAARADQDAVCLKDRSFTFGDLDQSARCWARSMRVSGVEPGDRVAIITVEKLEFLTAHLGSLYAAAVSLPLNPRLTRDELRYFLADSGARVVVAGDEQFPVVESLRSELQELGAVLPDAQPAGARADAHSEPAVSRDAPCLMLYSSGTTGLPKGVVHTHALEERLGRPVSNRYGMSEAHVITVLPLAGPWPQGSVGLPLEGIEVRGKGLAARVTRSARRHLRTI
jgi:acyl-CoA synthetase (AMP-forming)/AMP-acid ligase II